VTVRWSELTARTAAGDVVEPDHVGVTYQATADGGCDNTTVGRDDRGVIQVTGVERLVPPGAVLRLR
jgi:hypothetical protein